MFRFVLQYAKTDMTPLPSSISQSILSVTTSQVWLYNCNAELCHTRIQFFAKLLSLQSTRSNGTKRLIKLAHKKFTRDQIACLCLVWGFTAQMTRPHAQSRLPTCFPTVGPIFRWALLKDLNGEVTHQTNAEGDRSHNTESKTND